MDGLFEDPSKRKTHTRAKTRTQKQEANDILWDTLAELFYASGVGPDDKGLLGRVVKNLKAKHATPDEIRRRVANFRKVFPRVECGCTLSGLNRQWDKLGECKQYEPGKTKAQLQHEADMAETNRKLAEEKLERENAAAWYQDWKDKDASIMAIRDQLMSQTNPFQREYWKRNPGSLSLAVYRAWTVRNGQ